MNRHIITCGGARSGTSHIVAFVGLLIGKENVYHYKIDIISSHLNIASSSVPNNINSFIDNLKETVNQRELFFDANWKYSYIMSDIEREIPSMRFFILIRDIEDVVNSLKRRRWFKYVNRKGLLTQNQYFKHHPDEIFISYWFDIYEMILEQIKKMKYKPFILDFDKYISGVYSQLFRDLYNIHARKSDIIEQRKMMMMKINSSSQINIEKIIINENDKEKADTLKMKLKLVCKNNWVNLTAEKSPSERWGMRGGVHPPTPSTKGLLG